MENIFITLVCITMLLTGTAAMTMGAFSSIDKLSDAMKEQIVITNDIRMTDIKAVSSTTSADGTEADLTIGNEGHTALANFSKWDVIIKYCDGTIQRLPYGMQTPGWTVTGIYLNDQPELYEPNIFNSHETMKLKLKLSPPVTDNTTMANIVTSNGAYTSIIFGMN